MKPKYKTIVRKGLNDCCFRWIDKAKRKGRASYECIDCKGDVSLLWFYYQEAIKENK